MRQSVHNFSQKILDDKLGWFVGTPMDRRCQVAVTIPVYDETPELVLRCLSSLAEQQSVQPTQFEVIINVNNKKSDAENSSAAFLANQKILELLSKLADHQMSSKVWPLVWQPAIAKIQNFGLRICVLDSSSLENASEQNNVGWARNLAGQVAMARFKSIKQPRGIIAVTDIDCRFSHNYIGEIIRTFSEHDINAMAGQLWLEADPDTADFPILQRIAEVCGESRGWPESLFVPGKSFYFQKQEVPNVRIINTSQDFVLSARAFSQAGGFPPCPSSEDVRLANRVWVLPGEIVKDLNYHVISLVRPSQRAGWSSFGRRVQFILDSVQAYRAGQADRVYMLDRGQIKNFMFYLNRLKRNRQLTEQWLSDLLLAYGMEQSALWRNQNSGSLRDFLARWMQAATAEDYQALDNLINQHLYRHFPKIDITAAFARMT